MPLFQVLQRLHQILYQSHYPKISFSFYVPHFLFSVFIIHDKREKVNRQIAQTFVCEIVEGAQNIKFAPGAMEKGAAKKSEGFPSPTTYFWLGSRQTYTLRSDAVVREEDLRHIYNNFHFVGRFIAHLSHHYYYNTLSVICQVFFKNLFERISLMVGMSTAV